MKTLTGRRSDGPPTRDVAILVAMHALVRRLTAATLATVAGLVAVACSGSGGPAVPSPSGSAGGRPAGPRVALRVPAGLGGGPFASPRALGLPAGWTAAVWARIPDARMEAWTPQGDLLVSRPKDGSIAELSPAGHGTARPGPARC